MPSGQETDQAYSREMNSTQVHSTVHT